MTRITQLCLIFGFGAFSWLAMQVTHELGHVLGALASGGTVVQVVLHPGTVSRTDVFPNPHPATVAWSGPLVGILLPLIALLVGMLVRSPGVYLFRFFAGFCLVTNGLYIGLGPLHRLADAGDLLDHGSHSWPLLFFGVLTVPLGVSLWMGLGREFGFGDAEGRVGRRAALVSLSLLALLAGAEILTAGR